MQILSNFENLIQLPNWKHPSYHILLIFIKILCNHSNVNVNLKITLFLYIFLSDWIDNLEINHIILSKILQSICWIISLCRIFSAHRIFLCTAYWVLRDAFCKWDFRCRKKCFGFFFSAKKKSPRLTQNSYHVFLIIQVS